MRTGCYSRLAGHENGDWVACLEGGGYDGYDGTRHLDMGRGRWRRWRQHYARIGGWRRMRLHRWVGILQHGYVSSVSKLELETQKHTYGNTSGNTGNTVETQPYCKSSAFASSPARARWNIGRVRTSVRRQAPALTLCML